MARLERIRLTADAAEASGLLPVASSRILGEIGCDEAWWVCHDEGDLDAMVSLITPPSGSDSTDPHGWSASLIRMRARGGRRTDAEWSAEKFAKLGVSVHVVNSGGTRKRPDGIRAVASRGGAVHVTVGQTERDLVAGKAKPAAARHLVLDGGFETRDIGATEVERFEGFRKVEALAPRSDGRWLYALDDEDAIVLLISN